MKKLLNTLYVQTEDAYLSLDNANVVVTIGEREHKFPLQTLEQINYFGYKGASPALMGKCAELGIGLNFFRPSGRFLARVSGEMHGNVLLRKEQYRISDYEERSCLIARNFIVGKIYNARSLLARVRRDHGLSVDGERLKQVSDEMLRIVRLARGCENLDVLRGFEGEAASLYFSVFDMCILREKEVFCFSGRMKRPPTDSVNALLSFAYTMLANDCASALEGVGLDSYVGFLHRDRPGRVSLALDLMEELRAVCADRAVLTMINNRMIQPKHFQVQENGAVLLNEEGRKIFLQTWQERKREKITHPFLEEKIEWGLVPLVQAQLLARYIRGDLDSYPAFLWK